MKLLTLILFVSLLHGFPVSVEVVLNVLEMAPARLLDTIETPLVDFEFTERNSRNLDVILGPLTVISQSARTTQRGTGSVTVRARPGVRFSGITNIGMSRDRREEDPFYPFDVFIYDLGGVLVFETTLTRASDFSPWRLGLPLPGGAEIRWTEAAAGLRELRVELLHDIPEGGTLTLAGIGLGLLMFGRWRCAG